MSLHVTRNREVNNIKPRDSSNDDYIFSSPLHHSTSCVESRLIFIQIISIRFSLPNIQYVLSILRVYLHIYSRQGLVLSVCVFVVVVVDDVCQLAEVLTHDHQQSCSYSHLLSSPLIAWCLVPSTDPHTSMSAMIVSSQIMNIRSHWPLLA